MIIEKMKSTMSTCMMSARIFSAVVQPGIRAENHVITRLSSFISLSPADLIDASRSAYIQRECHQKLIRSVLDHNILRPGRSLCIDKC